MYIKDKNKIQTDIQNTYEQYMTAPKSAVIYDQKKYQHIITLRKPLRLKTAAVGLYGDWATL